MQEKNLRVNSSFYYTNNILILYNLNKTSYFGLKIQMFIKNIVIIYF